jgi:hypothetical protein
MKGKLRTFVEELLHSHAGWSLAGTGCRVEEGPAAAEVFMLDGVSLMSWYMVSHDQNLQSSP